MVDNSWQLGSSRSKSRSKSKPQIPPILLEPITDLRPYKNIPPLPGAHENKSTMKTPRASHTPVHSSLPEIDHKVITDKVYNIVKQAFRASYSESHQSQAQKSLISQGLEITYPTTNPSHPSQDPSSSRILNLNSGSDFINEAESSSFSRARFPSVHSGTLNNSWEYGQAPGGKL